MGLFPKIIKDARTKKSIGRANMLHYFGLTLEDWHYLPEDERAWYSNVWNRHARDTNAAVEAAQRKAKKATRKGRRS